MGQVGGNKSKGQFISRTGSFSTHGSRKGFVDVNIPIPEDQLLNLSEKRRLLIDKQQEIQKSIFDIRVETKIGTKHSFRQYEFLAKKGIFRNSHKASDLILEGVNLANEISAIKEEIIDLNTRLKEHGKARSDRMIDYIREHYPKIIDEAIKATKD